MHGIERYVSGSDFNFLDGNDELYRLVASQCLKLTEIPKQYYYDLVNEAYKRVLEQIKEKKSLEKGSISTTVYYAVLNAKRDIYNKYIYPLSVSRLEKDPHTIYNLLNNNIELDKKIDDEEEISVIDIIPVYESSYERIETSQTYEKIKQEAKKILDNRMFYIFFSYIELDKTFDEIAKEVGISRQRVNQLYYKAKRILLAHPTIRKLLADLRKK